MESMKYRVALTKIVKGKNIGTVVFSKVFDDAMGLYKYDEYITRKKILCSEKDYQLGKLQERYLRYKDCIKEEPDIEQAKALHQSIKI